MALETWRKRLVEAQLKEDIIGMKYFLSRFVSKIEVDYHTARLFYTYPIDDLKSLKDDFTAWGHCIEDAKIAGNSGDFHFQPGGANHDKHQGQ